MCEEGKLTPYTYVDWFNGVRVEGLEANHCSNCPSRPILKPQILRNQERLKEARAQQASESQIVNRSDCEHKTLFFGSGDYYLFCKRCDARWVCTNANVDIGSPELANKGVGSLLSGQVRLAPSEGTIENENSTE